MLVDDARGEGLPRGRMGLGVWTKQLSNVVWWGLVGFELFFGKTMLVVRTLRWLRRLVREMLEQVSWVKLLFLGLVQAVIQCQYHQ